MKIAITVSQITPGGGLTKYVCTLVEILSTDEKNEVWVITTHPSENNLTLSQWIDTKKNIKYIPLGDKNEINRDVSLITVLRNYLPDVIINNYNATTQYILPFLHHKTKIIHILHNNTPDFYRVAAINGRWVDAWIAPTPALVDYFNEYTGNKYHERVFTIPHGVEWPIYKPIKDKTIPQLSFVGVLYEHKGVKVLPPIIKKLLSKNYKFHFSFIGDGILKDELTVDLQEEINAGIVEFTGRVTGDEVYKKLCQTDIFVYPTHIDAFGLVIAESMINQAIPVVTHLKGITDSIVDDEVNGYLIGQDNVEMFVDRISQLLENRDLRKKMSLSAERKAKACFSTDVMRKNYLAFINKLVGSKN